MRPTSDTYFFASKRPALWAYGLWWALGSVSLLACLPALGVWWPLVILWPAALWLQWRSLVPVLSLRALQFDGHYCLLSQDAKEPVLCSITGKWQHLPWLISLELIDEHQRRFHLPILACAMDADSFRRLRIRVNTGQCNGP